MIFALGPNETFFHFSGEADSGWQYVCTGIRSSDSISVETLSDFNIGWPHEVALSPYGAGYFAYNRSSGGPTWSFISIKESARPNKRKERKVFRAAVAAGQMLSSWLSKHVTSADDIKTTKVRFGLAGRFMAWRPNGIWTANNLPPKLQAELKRRNYGTKTAKMPQLVTFGVGKAWAAIWDDGTHTVDLDGKYEGLAQYLDEFSNRKLLHISLDCGGKGTEFYVRFDGLTQGYCLVQRRTEIVVQDFNAAIRKRAIETGTDIPVSHMTGNATRSVTIVTPAEAKAAAATEAARAIAQSEDKVKEAARAIAQSEDRVKEATNLSIESSKKSIRASQVAIVGGAVAIATACTVM